MALRGAPYIDEPYAAYAEIWIGDTCITFTDDNRPQMFRSITVEKSIQNQATKTTVVLFDHEFNTIERLLAGNDFKLKYRYGYYSPSPGMRNLTPIYEASVSEINLGEMNNNAGLEYTLLCLPSTIVEGTSAHHVRSWEDMLISEIVEHVCEINGWTEFEIDKTIQVKDHCGIDSSMMSEQRLIQSSNDLQFISSKLAPRALRDPDYVGGYTVYIENLAGGSKLHFHPPRTDLSKVEVVAEYDYYFTPQMRYSEVLDWKPDLSGRLNILKGLAGKKLNIINPITGEVIVTGLNTGDIAKMHSQMLMGDILPKRGEKISKSYSGVMVKVSTANTAEEAWSKLLAEFDRDVNTAFKADLSVLGNPLLEQGKIIEMNAFLGDGSLHFSSGHYLINAITDTVDIGSYRTDMQLVRQAIPRSENINEIIIDVKRSRGSYGL